MNKKVKIVAYEDDYVGAGGFQDLSKWWDKLKKKGGQVMNTTQMQYNHF